MPRKKAPTVTLPDKVRVEFIKGDAFMEVRQAAKLAGVHPAVLEMARQLLKKPDIEAGVFQLATDVLRARADDIEGTFVKGLRRVAKAFANGGLAVKSHREGDRLTFWYTTSAPGLRKVAAK